MSATQTLTEADAALNQSSPTPFPLPIQGMEQVVAGSVTALKRTDWWVPGLRERVGAVLRDVPIERLVDGFSGARPYRVAPPSPSAALRALTAVGLALAEPDRAALVHLGIGSVADGAFTEALNLAALYQANVLFVVAVHPLDGDAPIAIQSAVSIETLANAFGIAYQSVDGQSESDVHDAVASARNAGGPQLIEARLKGNS
jgi:TPP-dependent pyruvate/acetoin dehydrogenase alpha subunit